MPHRFHLRDLPDIARWYAARGEHAPGVADLPLYGLVISGVAAGFLLKTDSNLAFLEGFVTNPAAGIRARLAAVDAITRGLLEAASEAGYTRMLVLSDKHGILRRAKHHGFSVLGNYVMMIAEI